MGQVNDLHIALEKKYDTKVKAVSYNVLYDDTDEIKPLIDLITRDAITMPAIFINDELSLEGRIDETAVDEILKSRGFAANR